MEAIRRRQRRLAAASPHAGGSARDELPPLHHGPREPGQVVAVPDRLEEKGDVARFGEREAEQEEELEHLEEPTLCPVKPAERILVPLAEGFEEIEAVTIVDVLRRAGLEVTVAGLAPGPVRGAHGIAVTPDDDLGSIDASRFTMIVLPGGTTGTRNLMSDERILALVRRLSSEGRRTAAICAAPLVLHAAGVLEGVPVTSHPSVREKLTGAVVRSGPHVVRSGPVTTSQGAGTAMEFALALVADLCGEARAAELARGMVAEPAS